MAVVVVVVDEVAVAEEEEAVVVLCLGGSSVAVSTETISIEALVSCASLIWIRPPITAAEEVVDDEIDTPG